MFATVSLTSFSFSFVDLIRALPPLPPVLLVFLFILVAITKVSSISIKPLKAMVAKVRSASLESRISLLSPCISLTLSKCSSAFFSALATSCRTVWKSSFNASKSSLNSSRSLFNALFSASNEACAALETASSTPMVRTYPCTFFLPLGMAATMVSAWAWWSWSEAATDDGVFVVAAVGGGAELRGGGCCCCCCCCCRALARRASGGGPLGLGPRGGPFRSIVLNKLGGDWICFFFMVRCWMLVFEDESGCERGQWWWLQGTSCFKGRKREVQSRCRGVYCSNVQDCPAVLYLACH